MPNNWWGTTDTSVIDQQIYDRNGNFTLGAVSYLPVANGPFENTAPTRPGTPVHSDATASSGYDDDGTLDFTWAPSWDDVGVDHYNVYVSEDGGAYGSVLPASVNSYNVAGSDGHRYKIKVEAVDGSAKVSSMSPESTEIFVDTTPLSSSVSSLPAEQGSTSFAVAWSGSDTAGGSSIKWYDVQYRDGLPGSWTA